MRWWSWLLVFVPLLGSAQTDITDFTDLDPNPANVTLADQWPSLIRAVHGLGSVFSAKYTIGTEPSDLFHGIIFAEPGGLQKAWRVSIDSNNDVLFDVNTNDDATPIWSTVLTIDQSTGIGSFAPLSHTHAAADVNSGTFADSRISQSSVDQHGVSTATANRIVKGKAGSAEIDEGWISELGVTQHEAALSVAGAQLTGVLGLKTISIPASAMRPTTTSGSSPVAQVELTPGQPERLALDFDGTTPESSFFVIPMPKSWDEGQVYAQFAYTVSAAVSTSVRFDVAGVCIGDDDPIDVAYPAGTNIAEDTFHGTSNDVATSAISSAFTLGGTPSEGDLCWFKLTRRPDVDTTTQDAHLIAARILYDTDDFNDD